MHKWIVGAVLVAGTCFLVKKTSFVSYAGTLWSQVATEAKKQIPTRFEIERARHEIAQLDKDITAMIRPLAEHKAEVVRLDKEIASLQTNLDGRREKLLKATHDFETVSTVRDGTRVQLDRDFEGFKRLEKQNEAFRKMRDAKQTAFDGAQAQLAKLVSRKRDFEVRLTQLEADEETIRVAALGSPIAIDDNRASAIEAALREIEHRHEVSRAEIELANGDLVSDTPAATATPSPSLSEMRAYLEKK
jgi:chromosome segregation ATPase